MPTPAQNAATAKYVKNRMRQFIVRCNNEKDADVIAYLEGCDNITEEVKRLVRDKLNNSE